MIEEKNDSECVVKAILDYHSSKYYNDVIFRHSLNAFAVYRNLI